MRLDLDQLSWFWADGDKGRTGTAPLRPTLHVGVPAMTGRLVLIGSHIDPHIMARRQTASLTLVTVRLDLRRSGVTSMRLTS